MPSMMKSAATNRLSGIFNLSFPVPQRKEVVIAIMGSTGAGKTTFVNLISDSGLNVGSGLQSCTDNVQHSKPFTLDGHKVILVDTPGFDDTTKSDAEILNIVCEYLSDEYKKHRRGVHGVIYLHRISDNKVAGSALRNLQFFQHLCGDEALRNCAIVTNMWNQVDPAVGESRENELKSKDLFFKPALDRQATMFRHDNTLESAQAVIRHLIKNTPLPLAIQREMVDEKKAVFQTLAGQALLGQLATLEQKHQREMDALKKELEEAQRDQDQEAEQEILESRERLEQEQVKVLDERARMFSPTGSPEPATNVATSSRKGKGSLSSFLHPGGGGSSQAAGSVAGDGSADTKSTAKRSKVKKVLLALKPRIPGKGKNSPTQPIPASS